MKKIITIILSMILLASIFLLYRFIYHCSPWGDNNLGYNFTLLEGDAKEDRMIVYCTSRGETNGCCRGGLDVIPSYKYHMDKNGNYSEYVEEAKSIDKWIIAKTFKIATKEYRYWILDTELSKKFNKRVILNSESLIRSYVSGPLNLDSLNQETQKLGIAVDFD